MVSTSLDHRGTAPRAAAFHTTAPLVPQFSHDHSLCSPRLRRNASVAPLRSARLASPGLGAYGKKGGWIASARAPPTDWAGLDGATFDALLAAGRLPLCLVGMSNCGKSHWSRRLRDDLRFRMQCVDDDIERALKSELSAGGFYGIDGLAAWMGFPTDERFSRAQEKYLAAEEVVTSTARGIGVGVGVGVGVDDDNSRDGDADGNGRAGNCVLDTTGSVVYLTRDTLQRLRQRFFIVHLLAGDDILESMTKRFFETPKPVVWGDAFECEDGETANEAIRRCYPGLLRERRVRYEELAHVSVQASQSLSRGLDVHGFLQLIRAQLICAQLNR